ncbi:MAG: symmetrical bis(5'-nucleosyl)-tetraphosphatase [Proteobacteria bacterium]|uniref:symmetrical bis(5'-nucleosyl)-tetraphosphatase n=1 Tax=Rudaea sp. TaxID=2136325 RepID=UPI001D9EB4FF|nr:symmetrical bis(5'-nucleosyl)-tetraphosphatase [Pseudomonadota bacterium]MBS0567096.1 symmetrical bis(5'-nucleosyl)-tetraphosphatase [Pseudomonadota bacterium]
MAVYAIGDVQGCHDELVQLLEKIRFDSARDMLWFCGDLVNRGGQSLAVLRQVQSFGDRAIVVLGNHDLSLLSIAEREEAAQARVNPELREVLFAPDRDSLLDWLRTRPLLHVDPALNFAMVHAGFAPGWTLDRAARAAREVEIRLAGEGGKRLLLAMFGNKPDQWSPKLRGIERMRATINVMTRMRYCDVRGRIAYAEKGAPGTQKPGLYPWFEVPGRVRQDARIVCGHWSTLGRFQGMGVYAIDGGCVWGGELIALRLDGEEPQFVSIKSARPRVEGD